MSTEIIKSVTFDEKHRSIRVCSESSNVTPKCYAPWYPTEEGYEYESWKRMFAASLFDGISRFMPSCTSKARKAFDLTNEQLFGYSYECSPWREAEKKYPQDRRYDPAAGKFTCDEVMAMRFDVLQDIWENRFLLNLNAMLA